MTNTCKYGHDQNQYQGLRKLARSRQTAKRTHEKYCTVCHRNRSDLLRKGIRADHEDFERLMRERDSNVMCSRGHRRTPVNTIVRANGAQECRDCRPIMSEENKPKDGLEALYGPIPAREAWDEVYDWVMVLRAAQGRVLPRPLAPKESEALAKQGLLVVASYETDDKE